MDERELAWLYHAQHTRHLEDIPFWKHLAARQGGPILELGCGTGRVMLPLAGSGYHLVGVDRSAAMLGVLQADLPPEIRPRISLVRADLTRFHFGVRFPLIILPCNTLSTLKPSPRRAALARVKTHLQGGGIFAASLPNPALLAALPENQEPALEEVIDHPISGNPVQVSSSWTRSPGGIAVDWIYDHLLPDGNVERMIVTSEHVLSSLGEYQGDLEAGGLIIIDIFGDYEGSPYSSESPFLILMAQTLE